MRNGALKELLVGASPAMVAVREQVAAAADAEAPVLIEGERGSGRECVARALHDTGPRHGRRFVRLVAGGTVLELDRDFERAAGGTLLVKDLVRAGKASQRRLLKGLRGRRGDSVRLVAATGGDLSRAVADQLFDPELAARLQATSIVLPPLRSRAADVAELATHFVREAGRELGRGRLHIAPRALDRLLTYPWPGNVAELRDVIGRAALRARHAAVSRDDIDAELPWLFERVPHEELSFEEMVRAKLAAFLDRTGGHAIEDLYDEVLARVERPLIELVLARADGNQLRAAKLLGLNRNTLRKKIVERGLDAPPRAPARPARRR